MKKIGLVATVAMLVLAAILIISCSVAPSQAAIEAQTTPHALQSTPQTASASSAALLTSQPPATPAASAAQSSTPKPTSWPMATPGPVPTMPRESSHLNANDYYIINIDDRVSIGNSQDPIYSQTDENDGHDYYPAGEELYNSDKWHLGIVDERGNLILPFEYNEIDELVYRTGNPEDSRPTPFYFFARGYSYEKNTLSGSETGYIYNDRGKLAFPQAFKWVTNIENKLIAGYREAGAESGAGVMTYDGKTVVPFTYEDIAYLGKKVIAAVGGEGTTRRVDFYNFNGTLKGTLSIGRGDTFEVSQVLVAKGSNGKYGFIDSSMTWCCPPKWEDVDNEGFCDGLFIVFIGNDDLYVNRFGKEFIPKGYEEDYASACTNSDGSYATIDGHIIYNEYNDSGSILFSDSGKILFSSADDIDYEDGVIVTGGRVFDIKGKDLLPGVTDVDQWLPDEKLFVCSNALYTSGGVKLPLHAVSSIHFLAQDRFLITMPDGNNGVCNSQGLWLVQPSRDYPDYKHLFNIEDGYNEGATWPVYSGTNGKFGLMDGNGNITTGPVYDECNQQGNLFEVWCGPVHGLVDMHGNWLWYSTYYNTLLD